MTINQEMIEGSWNRIKGQVHQRWGQLSDNELENARGSVEQLVGLIQQKTLEARDEVESYIEEVSTSGSSAMSQAAESVRCGAHQAAEVAEGAVARAADAARAGYAQTGTLIRRRPLESMSVCFGMGLITGLVVGLLVRSK